MGPRRVPRSSLLLALAATVALSGLFSHTNAQVMHQIEVAEPISSGKPVPALKPAVATATNSARKAIGGSVLPLDVIYENPSNNSSLGRATAHPGPAVQAVVRQAAITASATVTAVTQLRQVLLHHQPH